MAFRSVAKSESYPASYLTHAYNDAGLQQLHNPDQGETLGLPEHALISYRMN